VEWLEVSVATDGEAAEAVAESLSRYVYRGVSIEGGPDGVASGPVVVRAYIPVDERLSDQKRKVEEAIYHLGRIWPIPSPTFKHVAAEDWTEIWKERFDVLHVTDRLVVRPSWRTYEPAPGEIVILLDPGLAFGTGLHPTTRMCLQVLEHLVDTGVTVLDVGTGSGILAIAAAKLGASAVLGIDNDPVAVDSARVAVEMNDACESVALACGSLDEAKGSYDVVVVNILARVIEEMLADGLAARLRDGGTLVAAGILEDQAAGVEAALMERGLQIARQLREGDWVCLVARQTSAGGGPNA